MKSSLSTTDVQICVKYVEHFHTFDSIPLDCHALASKGFIRSTLVTQNIWRWNNIHDVLYQLLAERAVQMAGSIYGGTATGCQGYRSELEETGLTPKKIWFKYFWFIKPCIFCHLMLHKIFFFVLTSTLQYDIEKSDPLCLIFYIFHCYNRISHTWW